MPRYSKTKEEVRKRKEATFFRKGYLEKRKAKAKKKKKPQASQHSSAVVDDNVHEPEASQQSHAVVDDNVHVSTATASQDNSNSLDRDVCMDSVQPMIKLPKAGNRDSNRFLRVRTTHGDSIPTTKPIQIDPASKVSKREVTKRPDSDIDCHIDTDEEGSIDQNEGDDVVQLPQAVHDEIAHEPDHNMDEDDNKLSETLRDLLLRADDVDNDLDIDEDMGDDTEQHDDVEQQGPPSSSFLPQDCDPEYVPARQRECVRPLVLHFHEDEDLDYFVKEFISDYTKGRMNRSQGRRMWRLFFRALSRIVRHKVINMMSFETFERKLQDALPQPTVHWKVRRMDTGQIFRGKGKSFPEKRFANKELYETLCVWTRLSLKDVIRFHAALHPEANFIVDGEIDFTKVELNFTYDGIPLCKSSSDNLTVMGLRIEGCRQVYIPNVRVAKRAEPKDLSYFMDKFLDECEELGVKVNFFLADAPMRSFIKCIKGHAGRHSCEYCEASGQCIQRRIVYNKASLGQKKRTMASWLDNVEDLEVQREEDHSVTNVKGITGRSPLLRIKGFDIVKQAPSDPLHRDWLGIMKSTLWRHTVGLSKVGAMSAKGRRIHEVVSDVYKNVRLPSEFSHRSRAIDYPNFKGHEWKSLAISTFPTICEVVEREIDHQTAHVWLLFVFLILVYNGPVWVMKRLGKDYLKAIHEQLYEEFEECFGEGACTFNWHAFSHMTDIRECGSAPQLSTEPYESSYGLVQVSFAPGTRNVGLQIVRNMLMRSVDHVEGAGCKKHLKFEPSKLVSKRDDSLVIDKHMNYYEVLDVQGDYLRVKKILTEPWTSPIDSNLPMSMVGVAKYRRRDDNDFLMLKENAKGKAVRAKDGLLIPFYWDLLFS